MFIFRSTKEWAFSGESSAQQLRKLTQFAGRLAHFVQKRFARKLWFNDIKVTPF